MVAGSSVSAQIDRGVVTAVLQGDCFVSAETDVTFSTVLGSCISACIRDTETRIGGMNHFLLATQPDGNRDAYGASARYGAFAMEQLINMVLSRGSGRKTNLEIKVFGGGMMKGAMSDIGLKNIAFVREFLANEGYRLASEDVGGAFARRVMFQPYSGRAFVKRLDGADGDSVVKEELTFAGKQRAAPAAADIELF